jgi:hypothetical protein
MLWNHRFNSRDHDSSQEILKNRKGAGTGAAPG